MKKLRTLRAERLEDRRMLHGDGPLPSITLETNQGDITIELFAEDAPLTVDNFLNYVDDGDYINSIFHRSVPEFVIQGGGFTTTTPTLCADPCGDIDAGQFANVPTDPPVMNEFGRSNLRTTVSMAKLGNDPNSATSQFFVNLNNNSGNLDGQNGGFTVFGQVLDMTVPDRIADLDIGNLSSVRSAFNEFPFDNNEGTLEAVTVLSLSGTAVVEGTVFLDSNANGTLGAGEGGLSGAEVFLDANDNGILDDGEESTTTDDLGRYHFLVAAGTHVVRVLPYHADYQATTAESDSAILTIGRAGGPDFGFQYTGTSWHNPVNEADVDGINGVTPLDALLVINELTLREFSDLESGELPELTEPPDTLRFLDVVEDNIVAPLDALIVINNLPGENVSLRAGTGDGATLPSSPDTPLSATTARVTMELDQEEAVTHASFDAIFAALGAA